MILVNLMKNWETEWKFKKHDEEREKKDKEYKEELEEIIRRNVQYIKTPDKSKRANRGRKNRRTRILI